MVDPADRNLIPDQFPEMNERFYAANPPAYFRTRLDALVLVAGRPQAVADAFAEGIKIGTLEVRNETPSEPYATEAEIQNYAVTEAVVLLHHASEALLRLFFAHEFGPECPWLEAARLRGPRAFKDRVEQLIGLAQDRDQEDRVARWLLGRTAEDVKAQPGDEGRTGADALQGTVEFLILTARRLLTEASLYNSAKHGLTVLPGDRGVSLAKDQIDIDLSVQGPSMAYLERRVAGEGQAAKWNESTTWVQIDRWLAWTQLVLRQMRSIWAIAKLAYLGEAAQVHPVFPQFVEAVTKSDRTFVIETMSMQLAYYVDNAPDHLPRERQR